MKRIVVKGRDWHCNLAVDEVEREGDMIFAYRGGKFVGMWDLGAVDCIWVSEAAREESSKRECPGCGRGIWTGGMRLNIALNADCMDVMREYPDGYFDLAVVDPPYGDAGGTRIKHASGGAFSRFLDGRGLGETVRKKFLSWDIAPSEDYFNELFRVSKEQIIWGGNYFGLPPTRCFLVWVKTNIPEDFTMAMAEYAWCSFDGNAKVIRLRSDGIPGRFHPTQKPEQLYRWIYGKYTKPGFKILDTHLGSGSSRRAAWDFGLDFVGCEVSKEYFDKQEAAFAEYTAQVRLEL